MVTYIDDYQNFAMGIKDGLPPASNPNPIVITGTPGPDDIEGNAYNNLIRGLEDNDTITGAFGTDLIYGNQGDDQISGNAGNDTIFGGQGLDVIYGNADNDLIYGNLGNDSLYGGQGTDVLFGGQGDDLLTGNLGNDTMTGGLGADTYAFAPGDGNDTVTDFNAAQGDKLNLGGQTFTTGTDAQGNVVLLLSGGGSIVLQGVTSFDEVWVA